MGNTPKKILENILLKRIKTQKQFSSTPSNLNSIKEFPSIDSIKDQNTPNKKLENILVERMETQKHCSSTPKTVFDKENSVLSSTNSFPKKFRKKKKNSFKRIDLNLPISKHTVSKENNIFLKRKNRIDFSNIPLANSKNYNLFKPQKNTKEAI